jgi:uncharacterized protein (DUF58 family)
MEILVLIGILLAVFLVEVIYYNLHALDDLSLKVNFSKNIADYGEDIELIEVVENKKRLPLPFIILKFETPREIKFYDTEKASTSDFIYREDMLTMKAFSKHTRRIKAKCTKRGYYVFPRVGITTSDPFLIERFTKDFDNDAHLVVLPEVQNAEITRILMSVTLSELQCRRTLLTDPFSLAGIREYTPHDPMKSINWKASARTGELMVNQNASTCSQKVHVFVNLDYYNPKRSTSLLEKSISLTYTYLRDLADLNIPAAVYTNGLDIITEKPVVSETDLGSATLEERAVKLARIDLTKRASSFDETLAKYIPSTEQDDFILVISSQYSDNLQKQLADMKLSRPSLHWLMPCYKASQKVNIDPSLADSYTRWEVLGHD